MVDWTAAKLKALGAQVELAELGEQTLHDGTKIQLPKAILGQLGNVSDNKFEPHKFQREKSKPINQIDTQWTCY